MHASSKLRRTAHSAFPQPLHRRPLLELLEDRCVPSTVTNLNDADLGSLRQAIIDTPSGGTVDFQPGLTGTITLSSGELMIAKNLTIAGPGASVITISGNHASRVFNVAATFTVHISGLTIADGSVIDAIFNAGTLTVTSSTLSGNYALVGGGIYNFRNGTLTVTSSALGGNSTLSDGGGIYHAGDTLTVISSTLSGNSSGRYGGGIYHAGNTLTVSASIVSGNSAPRGGGIFNRSRGTLAVTDSTLSGNSALYGGGIDNDGTGTLTVTSSTLSGNSATYGGGISNSAYNGGTLTVSASIVSGNSAIEGGGIYNESFDRGTLTVTNSTLSGNSAVVGGGIYNSDTLTVTNSTLSGNSANGGGGGIYNDGFFLSARLTVTSATLSGNSAKDGAGGGIANRGPLAVTNSGNTLLAGNAAPSFPDVDGALNSQGHNLIGDGTGGSGFVATDVVGTSTFLIDAMLEPLADYGGPTPTMRPLPNSPVINAGDNTDAPNSDQRGFPRIVLDFIDIGAVELQPSEFGGPSSSIGAEQVLTFRPTDSPAAGANTQVSAWAAPAAVTKSTPVDRSRLDVLFGLLGSRVRQRDGVALDLAPHLRSKGVAELVSWAWFNGVAAVDNNP